MTLEQIIFLVVATLTLAAGFMVVSARNLVHSALWLVVALFGVAILYALLQAGFLAVVQVVVYIGAIAILIIFAIMLVRNPGSDDRVSNNENWTWALVVALVVFFGLAVMLANLPGVTAVAPELSGRVDPLLALGNALVNPDLFVLPFELASVLLLAALIGALVIAREHK
ncbi:MAG: NADH-quinone oxidoreductase subunit J [Chloroflexota bacterium]